MKATNRLEPEDWIKAASRALTLDGHAAIKVEKIARDLGVTKGSFYWHFKDLKALQHAMLEHWEIITTDEIIAAAENSEDGLESILLGIMTYALIAPPEDYGGPGAESAIREWARHDDIVQDCLRRVDARRLSFLKSQFRKHGFNASDAEQKTAMFYSTVIGAGWLSNTTNIKLKTLEWFIRNLLAKN